MANLPRVGVEAVIEGMGKFEADSKKVNKALGNIETSTSKLGSIASEVTSKITSLGGSLLKIGALGAGAGILAIGTGLFKAGQAGLSMNDALEQASAKINAFTKDGAKTAEILEMIRDRASKTPFEFQEMANAAAGLLPASKQAGIGLEDIIEQAEILAASNPAEGLEGAAFALREAVSGDFTSIIERFNLPRTMINQLKEEGLPNLEIVSRAMQELGFDTDLVAALAETAQGRWSTFKDTLTNVAATVTQPIFTAFSQSLGDINAWLTANEPMLTAMANILANQVATAITTIAAESTRLFSAFQSGGTGGLFTALGMGDLVAMWATAQPILFELVTWLNTNIPIAIQIAVESFTMFSNWWLTTWPTIQAAALTGWEILKSIFVGFQVALGPILTQLNTQFTQVFNQIGAVLASFGLDWQDVWDALLQATGIVMAGIGALLLGIIGVISGVATGVASGVSSIIATMTSLWEQIGVIFQGIQTIIQGWIQVFSGDLSGLTVVIEGTVTLWQGIFGTFLTLVKGTLDLILSTIGGFVRGAIAFFQGMYHQLVGGSIIPDMINAIAGWFKRLPQMIMSGLGSLVSMIVEPFEEALEAVGEIWKPEKWLEIGESIIEGILEGVKKNQDKVIEMLKSLMADVIKGAKDVIGFGSPAKEFMTIGESMVQGMLLGAKKEKFAKRFVDDLNMGGIARELGTGGGQWRNFRNIIKNTIGGNFEQLMTSGMSAAQIIDKIQKIAAQFNFPPSFASEFAMANGLIEHLTSSVTEFQKAMRLENMGRMLQLGGQLASIGSGFADMLKESVDSRQAFIDQMKGFLDDTSQDIFTFTDEIGTWQMDRNSAQIRYNQLLEEQRQQEEQITKQKKSQEQLSFLQQQIELIKMGKELGGNIFQGLKFGLDASISDLLTATNNVVEAMVNQINDDLQISSPSKVMARIGQQMMAGLQGGIASMTPVLNAQLSASVAGPLSPAMAGAMNSNSYSTTNMFNLGGNTISNGMDAASFEARVLQVIRRNL